MQDESVIVDDRKPAQRIDPKEGISLVLAGPIEVDRHHVVLQAEHGKQQPHLVTIARKRRVAGLDHVAQVHLSRIAFSAAPAARNMATDITVATTLQPNANSVRMSTIDWRKR